MNNQETALRYMQDQPTVSGNMITGYAIVYNSPSRMLFENGVSFVEIIAPGAATDALQNSNTRALYEHDPKQILGRKSSGTLRLAEDSRGVKYEIDLPDTTSGRDAKVSVSRQDVTGASFQLVADRRDISWSRKNGVAYRTVHKLSRLPEITITSEPVYTDTSAALRSYQEWEQTEQQKEIPLIIRVKQKELAELEW